MSEALNAYQKAVAGLDARIAAIKPDQWSNATPCDEWSVEQVVKHVTEVQGMIASVVSGTPAQPEKWKDARDAALASVSAPGALTKMVETPFGAMPVEAFITILLGDAVIHSWDIARGASGDERLDADLVERVFGQLRPMDEMLRASGRFKEKVEPPAGADAQTQLLCFAGRKV